MISPAPNKVGLVSSNAASKSQVSLRHWWRSNDPNLNISSVQVIRKRVFMFPYLVGTVPRSTQDTTRNILARYSCHGLPKYCATERSRCRAKCRSEVLYSKPHLDAFLQASPRLVFWKTARYHPTGTYCILCCCRPGPIAHLEVGLITPCFPK
jgi:hypothetical protein